MLSLSYSEGASKYKHFNALVNADFTKTFPFRDVFVSLFINKILNTIPSEKPYALIFDEMIAFDYGKTISGAFWRMIEAKIIP
jgi:hypothetical protein